MPKIKTPNELYDAIVKVTTPEERGHWISDLQCKVTNSTAKIIYEYEYKTLVTTFRSAIDGTMWYEIPFAYTPYWEGDTKC